MYASFKCPVTKDCRKEASLSYFDRKQSLKQSFEFTATLPPMPSLVETSKPRDSPRANLELLESTKETGMRNAFATMALSRKRNHLKRFRPLNYSSLAKNASNNYHHPSDDRLGERQLVVSRKRRSRYNQIPPHGHRPKHRPGRYYRMDGEDDVIERRQAKGKSKSSGFQISNDLLSLMREDIFKRVIAFVLDASKVRSASKTKAKSKKQRAKAKSKDKSASTDKDKHEKAGAEETSTKANAKPNSTKSTSKTPEEEDIQEKSAKYIEVNLIKLKFITLLNCYRLGFARRYFFSARLVNSDAKVELPQAQNCRPPIGWLASPVTTDKSNNACSFVNSSHLLQGIVINLSAE